jgi:guanylate kinase
VPIHCDMPLPLLIVVGPSASGKSSAVRRLHQTGVVHVHPTWTTRPRRHDEQAGSLEHRFVTDAIFDELETADFFLGTVVLPGLPYRYALPQVTLTDNGPIHAVMARAPFLDLFAPHFSDRLVYEIDDTFDRARQRLIERGSDAHEVEARLAGHHAEVEAGRKIASRCFVNDGTLDELVGAIAASLRIDVPAMFAEGAARPA